MVDVTAVEKYYWVVKRYHLQNLRTFYESEIHSGKQDNWTLRAALLALKGAVEGSIEVWPLYKKLYVLVQNKLCFKSFITFWNRVAKKSGFLQMCKVIFIIFINFL